MNYCGLNLFDTANGEGVRVSLFVSGCRLRCKGCFNAEARDFNYGKPYTEETLFAIENALKNPYIKGLSVLGGDPMEPEQEGPLLVLFEKIKTLYPDKTIWVWTGRVHDQVKNSPLMQYIDVLVDGPFVESKKDPKLLWRGSSNQKIIYLKQENK